jgi:hypothetical protein
MLHNLWSKVFEMCLSEGQGLKLTHNQRFQIHASYTIYNNIAVSGLFPMGTPIKILYVLFSLFIHVRIMFNYHSTRKISLFGNDKN